MCQVIQMLNKKPKSTRPSEMRTIAPGEKMLLGKGIMLVLNSIENVDTDTTTYFFGLHKKDRLAEALDISNVIIPSKNSTLRVTPISIVLSGEHKGKVHLYIQLTKTLQEIFLPAS